MELQTTQRQMVALCYGGLGAASSESAKLVEDSMCWNVLTPVRGSYPKSTDPSPMAGRQLRKMGEVPFLDTESIGHVTCGFSKDKEAASFMPALSLGDLSHQWSVSYRVIRGHVTWGSQQKRFSGNNKCKKNMFSLACLSNEAQMGPALPNSLCDEELAFLERLLLPWSRQTNDSIAGTTPLLAILCRMVPGCVGAAVSLALGNI